MPCRTPCAIGRNLMPITMTQRHRKPIFRHAEAQSVDDEYSGDSNNTSSHIKRLKMAWAYIQQKQQYSIVLLFYLFHLVVLTQNELVFPVQLIPNKKGHFTGIGWDSLAGIFTLCIYRVWRRKSRQANTLSSDTGNPLPNYTPWNLPSHNPRHRLTSVITAGVLVNAYLATGRFAIFWEDTIYALSGLGFPITSPMQRSLCVLLGHLSWLVLGALLLRWLPRPPKFFQPANHENSTAAEPVPTEATSEKAGTQNFPPFVWFRSSRKSKWLWWVIGGYLVSGWLFNIADLVNQYILPESVLEDAQESVVSQLVNPEHNDWLASLVGYVAPCITAPWWEEILYRGFALAGLTQLVGYRWAVFLQGVIFSAHHMSLAAALPLAVLGWTWAVLYTKSRNLWVVVAVHSLWNSRVFLGSWLGL